MTATEVRPIDAPLFTVIGTVSYISQSLDNECKKQSSDQQ